MKWQGSTVVRMLRVHGPNRDDRPGQTVLHMACVVAHKGTNPIQLHYASLLLQVLVISFALNVGYSKILRLLANLSTY